MFQLSSISPIDAAVDAEPSKAIKPHLPADITDETQETRTRQDANDVCGTIKELPAGTTHQSEIAHSKYEGDYVDSSPAPEGGYKVPEQALDFQSPFDMLAFFDKDIAEGIVTLHPWQMEVLDRFGEAKPTAQHPFKYCLVASNGSGKDKYCIAPIAVWFILTKVRSRVIGTTSSGTQLTSQTEPYIKDLCEKINGFLGIDIFLIRQRYIKCLSTGSEIRLFATDEAGKAEGYHPMDPNAEMLIFENEAKSISEDIDRALRRCSGFNYWFKCSSTGQPKGHFYLAATNWTNVKYITSYDCPHVSQDEIETDRLIDGEHSAFFRSKHLSEFTSEEGQVVISLDLVNSLLKSPPTFIWSDRILRIGLDLAAGGDENVVCIVQGNRVIAEFWFREKDTVIGAQKISSYLISKEIPKDHEFIFADDGGVGRGIIDNLVHLGWSNINRINNQWPCLGDKKRYGNRGAENWYRVRRILEERLFDIRGLSDKTREQLYNRYFRQSETGGRIFLQSKKEAKAQGHPSPDRADAFVLSLSGLSVDDLMAISTASPNAFANLRPYDNRPRELVPHTDIERHYDDNVVYANYRENKPANTTNRRIFGIIRAHIKG